MIIDHIGFNVSDLAAARAMIGKGGKGQFWFGSFGASPGPIHIAFSADNRAQYHPDYYGAFVIGPDGHNIEAVCHAAEA